MDKPLAAALKAARKRLGISQNELAKRAGISRMGPSSWERGRRPMTFQCATIAKAYQIPEETVWDLRLRKRAARSSTAQPVSSSTLPFKRL